jgi:hypothetical protein
MCFYKTEGVHTASGVIFHFWCIIWCIILSHFGRLILVGHLPIGALMTQPSGSSSLHRVTFHWSARHCHVSLTSSICRLAPYRIAACLVETRHQMRGDLRSSSTISLVTTTSLSASCGVGLNPYRFSWFGTEEEYRIAFERWNINRN